jgi:hypothetical protein
MGFAATHENAPVVADADGSRRPRREEHFFKSDPNWAESGAPTRRIWGCLLLIDQRAFNLLHHALLRRFIAGFAFARETFGFQQWEVLCSAIEFVNRLYKILRRDN